MTGRSVTVALTVAVLALVGAGQAGARPLGRGIEGYVPAETVIVKPSKARRTTNKRKKPKAITTTTPPVPRRTTTSPVLPIVPKKKLGPTEPAPTVHQPRWRAGDNQYVCNAGGDPGPWLLAHGDNTMRFIVNDGVAGQADQSAAPTCIHQAEAEGFRVLLSVVLDAQWTPMQDAQRITQTIARFGPVWAVSIGNEEDLGATHDGSMTAQSYARAWAAAEPALATADPGALRVFADASPRGGDWMERAWNDGHRGAQVAAMNCYAVGWTIGMAQVPTFAAWAKAQGVPLWCPEMARTAPSAQRLLTSVETQTTNLQMISDYYWPAAGDLAQRYRR